MEIDEPELAGPSKGKKQATIPVDDAHPFDLEAYISSYNGRTIVDRLSWIIQQCPTLAPQALQIAMVHVPRLRDPNIATMLLHAYEQAVASGVQENMPSFVELSKVDQTWIDELNRRNSEDRVKLEVELKTYSSNMIKESIRMAHRDLGEFFRATGDYQSALKQYQKLRDVCTTSQHVLDMCLSVLELLIESRNFNIITSYVYKAEPALDATSNMLRNSNQGPTATAAPPGREKIAAEREKVQSKLDLATAFAHMAQGTYDKAATYLLKIGSIKSLGHWIGTLVSASDIAIYGTLCALASFHRSSIKAQLLDNPTFAVYIEQEPYIRELIEAYMASKFKTVLEILDRYSTRHFLDLYLTSHVVNLTNLIRSHALVLYFQPFTSIKLESLSTAFGWTPEYLEQQVVALIQAGEIQARVDKQNKILKARDIDQRAVLFTRAMKAGKDMQATNRKLLLRMRLQQAELIVKPPKTSQQTTAHPNELGAAFDQ
ncbi:G protein pathway suppressor 1 [Irpex rosettiformis]|uniref:G protein pathway suppressor 1 n=1 Tax=Irpex rosettiformis TaxID=378272 RepID=A0ACB8U2I9_9APHY|nr:G protein pathway suppressor 1 [Irpex rosettiformis]